MSKQKTLKGSFSLCGKGLHTGLSLTVTFNPAPENSGYKIQRIDLEGMPVIQAIAENVIDTQRGTVLGKGDIRVSTIEHGMSALYAMGIDNCLIQVNGPEFPILDGSAAMYVDKINEVGFEEQNAPKDWYIIRHKIEVKDEKTGSCITILPDEDFSLTAMCSFNSKFINSQFASLEKTDDFAKEIAPARTFVFVRDIEPLLKANLIKGGDLDNAIVIYEQQTTQERLDALADMIKVERRDAEELGYIQHKPLVWETSVHVINFSILLVIWLSSANQSRDASSPPDRAIPSTISSQDLCVARFESTKFRRQYTIPMRNQYLTISRFANFSPTAIRCNLSTRLSHLAQQASSA